LIRYQQLSGLIDDAKPQTIVEIGTHVGARAVMMCLQALKHNDQVRYIGYDLFDEANPDTDRIEMNGKGRAPMVTARKRLDEIAGKHPQFSYTLVKGNTRDTLHGDKIAADFVFIDGGHSVETIRGDYKAVEGSKVVVFDDYYTGINTEKFGCNSIVADIPHRVLPATDGVNGGGAVQMVVSE
jgi:predicted O-methyltransferase YrrM